MQLSDSLIEELQFGWRCERSNAARLLQSNDRDEVLGSILGLDSCMADKSVRRGDVFLLWCSLCDYSIASNLNVIPLFLDHLNAKHPGWSLVRLTAERGAEVWM